MSARTAAAGALPLKYQQRGSAAAQLYLLLNFPSHPVKGWLVVLLPQQITSMQNSAVCLGAKVKWNIHPNAIHFLQPLLQSCM